MRHGLPPIASERLASCSHSFGVRKDGGSCRCWSPFSFWVFLLFWHRVRLSRPSSTRCSRSSPMLTRALQAWKRLVRAIGNLQARILLTVFYAIIVFPFGMVARVFSDPLRIRRRPTQWLERGDETHDLRWAKRQ